MDVDVDVDAAEDVEAELASLAPPVPRSPPVPAAFEPQPLA